jgi:O-antigen/teichoic acid export membrane protein
MSIVGRNLVWLLMTQLASWAMTLATLLIVPDALGRVDLGKLGFALAYVGFFQLVASLGTSTFIVKEIARDHALVGPYVVNGVVLKIGLALVLSFAALGFGALRGYDRELMALIALGCVSMLFAVVNEMFVGGLSGMSRMAKPAVFTAAQVYVSGIGGILIVKAGYGLVAYAAWLTLSGIVPVLATGRLVWPHLRGHWHIDPQLWRILIRGGLPFFVIVALNVVYSTIGIPILRAISGDGAVGDYDLAVRWATIPIFVSTAVAAAYFPAFSAEAAKDPTEFASLVRRAMRIVLLVSIPAGIGLSLVAGDIIAQFHTVQFERAIPVLRIAALEVPFAALDTVLAMALVASEKARRFVIVGAVAAVLNPIACVIVIRIADDRGNGATGLAIASLVTELFIMAGTVRLLPRSVVDGRTVRWCLRCAAAAIAMVPAVWLANDQPLIVEAFVGIVAYGVASLAFGTVSMATVRGVVHQVLDAVGLARPQPVTRSDDGATDLGGHLHTEPGGQDRGGGDERAGERASVVRPDDHRPEHE